MVGPHCPLQPTKLAFRDWRLYVSLDLDGSEWASRDIFSVLWPQKEIKKGCPKRGEEKCFASGIEARWLDSSYLRRTQANSINPSLPPIPFPSSWKNVQINPLKINGSAMKVSAKGSWSGRTKKVLAPFISLMFQDSRVGSRKSIG